MFSYILMQQFSEILNFQTILIAVSFVDFFGWGWFPAECSLSCSHWPTRLKQQIPSVPWSCCAQSQPFLHPSWKLLLLSSSCYFPSSSWDKPKIHWFHHGTLQPSRFNLSLAFPQAHLFYVMLSIFLCLLAATVAASVGAECFVHIVGSAGEKTCKNTAVQSPTAANRHWWKFNNPNLFSTGDTAWRRLTPASSP